MASTTVGVAGMSREAQPSAATSQGRSPSVPALSDPSKVDQADRMGKRQGPAMAPPRAGRSRGRSRARSFPRRPNGPVRDLGNQKVSPLALGQMWQSSLPKVMTLPTLPPLLWTISPLFTLRRMYWRLLIQNGMNALLAIMLGKTFPSNSLNKP